VVRRRYTRVLNESKVQSPKSKVQGSEAGQAAEARWEGGEPVAGELQKLVNETSVAVRRGRPVKRPDLSSTGARPSLPDLILIDGGKGQLGAACQELQKLGLSHIPVIGLAKEFEEIYRPGEKEPLRLPPESGALKLLQRVRDESHRLANTYNATLRLRKISESILDEFPSIGERRKAALLKKFGSVQRIRLASLEQIAQVPGFGGKAASELKAFLEARSQDFHRPISGQSGP
jgi:excinuclease ABC subunit C